MISRVFISCFSFDFLGNDYYSFKFLYSQQAPMNDVCEEWGYD